MFQLFIHYVTLFIYVFIYLLIIYVLIYLFIFKHPNYTKTYIHF
jgi:hypothetical protein